MPIDRVKFSRVPRQQQPRDEIVVEGKAEPNATVTIENRSAAPFGPVGEASTFTQATADNSGVFKAAVAAGEEGDWVRLSAGGSPLDVRIAGTAPTDGRRAEVAQQALRLVPGGNGQVDVTSVSRNPRLSEPFVKVVFENKRTHERTEVTLDANGQLPKGLRLNAAPGDTVTLYATDGAHDKDLADPWALLAVPAAGEPAMHPGVRRTIEVDGPLFIGRPSMAGPLQGSGIGDCYLVAAASSIADLLPEVLERCIKDKPDGTVDVTFQRWSADDESYVSETINVTRKLAWGAGKLHYGRCEGPTAPDQTETWWPLLEKAYAVWKGGYPAISSGYPYEIFEALLGTQGRHFDPSDLDERACAKVIERALRTKAPMVAWTWPDSMDRPFVGSGLVADHAYSVHGFKEEGGDKLVQLRNPWGKREWGRDGKDDGLFWMPLATFREKFCGLGAAYPD